MNLQMRKIKTIVSHPLTLLHISNLKVFTSLVGLNYLCIIIIPFEGIIRKSTFFYHFDGTENIFY
jgi:hypothetical protein